MYGLPQMVKIHAFALVANKHFNAAREYKLARMQHAATRHIVAMRERIEIALWCEWCQRTSDAITWFTYHA